jgi:hypothetical protein
MSFVCYYLWTFFVNEENGFFSKVHVIMNKIFYARFGNHLNSINYKYPTTLSF